MPAQAFSCERVPVALCQAVHMHRGSSAVFSARHLNQLSFETALSDLHRRTVSALSFPAPCFLQLIRSAQANWLCLVSSACHLLFAFWLCCITINFIITALSLSPTRKCVQTLM